MSLTPPPKKKKNLGKITSFSFLRLRNACKSENGDAERWTGDDDSVISGIMRHCFSLMKNFCTCETLPGQGRILLCVRFGLLYCCIMFLSRLTKMSEATDQITLSVQSLTWVKGRWNNTDTVAQPDPDRLFSRTAQRGFFIPKTLGSCFLLCSRQAPSLYVYIKRRGGHV